MKKGLSVKTETLLAVAGSVWIIAGVNVARLGVLAYVGKKEIFAVDLLLSLTVFACFGDMFYRMSRKHAKRIRAYAEPTRAIWHFFDRKSYLIMAVMMSGGIWLRSSGLVSESFIAVFYTGLGCALTLAGLLFWQTYLSRQEGEE